MLEVPIQRDRYGRSIQIPVDKIIDGILESQPAMDLPNTTPKEMLERLARVLYPAPSLEDFKACVMGIPMLRMHDTSTGDHFVADLGEFHFDEQDKIVFRVLAGDPQKVMHMRVHRAVYALCVGSSIRSVWPESQDAYGHADF